MQTRKVLSVRISTSLTFPNFEKYEFQKNRLLSDLINQIYDSQPDIKKKEICRKAGISMSTLYGLRSGRTRYPRLDTIWKLAQFARIKLSLAEIKKLTKK